MKTFVALFLSSTAFGLAIAIAYWLIAHQETTGTVLLGIMTAAFAFAALYAVVAERDAHIDGDDAQMTAEQTSGEDLGVYTTQSAYPILLALSCLVMLLGVLYSPLLGCVALVAAILCLWRLGAESARM